MEPPPLFTVAGFFSQHLLRVPVPTILFFLTTVTFHPLATASKPKADKPRHLSSTMKLRTKPSPTLHFILLLLLLLFRVLPSSHATALTTDQEEILALPNQTLVLQSSSTTTTTTTSLSLLARLVLQYHHLIHPRSPVETPPTEYLPYPPPPNYTWPPGTSPATEDPQPSEFDPPPGFYTDARVGSGSDGGNNAQAALTSQGTRIRSLLCVFSSLGGGKVVSRRG